MPSYLISLLSELARILFELWCIGHSDLLRTISISLGMGLLRHTYGWSLAPFLPVYFLLHA